MDIELALADGKVVQSARPFDRLPGPGEVIHEWDPTEAEQRWRVTDLPVESIPGSVGVGRRGYITRLTVEPVDGAKYGQVQATVTGPTSPEIVAALYAWKPGIQDFTASSEATAVTTIVSPDRTGEQLTGPQFKFSEPNAAIPENPIKGKRKGRRPADPK